MMLIAPVGLSFGLIDLEQQVNQQLCTDYDIHTHRESRKIYVNIRQTKNKVQCQACSLYVEKCDHCLVRH